MEINRSYKTFTNEWIRLQRMAKKYSHDKSYFTADNPYSVLAGNLADEKPSCGVLSVICLDWYTKLSVR